MLAMRTLILSVIIFASAGCGGRSGSNLTSAADGAVSPDRGSTTNFCSGGNKARRNGAAEKVLEVAGQGHPQMSCCNDLGFVTFRLPERSGKIPLLMVTFAVMYPNKVTYPMTVDLAAPPKGWQFLAEYYLCEKKYGVPCARAGALKDSLSSAQGDKFSGTLQVRGGPKSKEIDLCLTGGAGTKAPHPHMKSLRLHAKNVRLR